MNPQKNKPQDLSKEQLEATNGGGIAGGDDNSSYLSTGVNLNISSSNTDDNGDTSSHNFGGSFGSDTSSVNNND